MAKDIITPDDPGFNNLNQGPLLPPDPNVNQPIILGDNPEALTPKGKNAAYQEEMDIQKTAEAEIMKKQGQTGYIKYATSLNAYAPDPWYKNAQQAGTSNVMANPMWFSPLHTPQNWQIASKRREIYQWSFISNDENPCYLTKYGDFSLINIKDAISHFLIDNDNLFMDDINYIQNNVGERAKIDKVSIRQVEKKANKIKCLGQFEPIVITNDHDCITIKRKDVKCKYHKTKNCVYDNCAPTCIRSKCNDFEDKEYTISKVKARDVKKGDYFLIPFSTEIKKSIIKTEDQARFAGHLASDGSVYAGKYKCNNFKESPNTRICMNTQEIEYVYPTVERIYQSFGVAAVLEKRSTELRETRTGSIKVHDFASSLVVGKGNSKKFTQEVMLLNPELQLHVIGAYIQSDGTFNKINQQVEITTYSKHLANQLLHMFYRCDVLASGSKQPISKSDKTFKTDNEYRYIIQVKSSDCHKLKKYCPGKIPDFKKKVGANKRFFWKNYVVTPITSNILFDYKGEVYDIRVPLTFAITANGAAIHQCRFFTEGEPKVAAGVDFYCFGPKTQILMSDGEQKSISSVDPGDLIRSHDGSINPVIRKFSRITKETMLKIKISGVSLGDSMLVTKGHEILTQRGGEIKFVQAQELEEGDYLLTPADYSDDSNEKSTNKEDKYTYSEIQSIQEHEYEGTVYDLEIENSHSYVANRVSVHNSAFPMNGFKLECRSRKILKFFEKRVIPRLKLNEMFKQISHEYFTLGDVFIHLDVHCPVCKGTGKDPDNPNELCNHPGGTFKKIIVLNPDWIEVQRTPFSDEPAIVMIPDEDLKRIVYQRQPKILYDRIPDHIKNLVTENKPIPLSNRTTSHLKHMPVPYGTYGTSLIRRLFTTLAYKTKIMTANWIVAERLIIPVRVVKVGSDDRPASSADIADIQNQLAQTSNDPNLTIVTHNNFDYEWYGACHDEQTEVLTDCGFKAYDQVNIDEDKILTYDKDTNSFVYDVASELHEYDYDGEMVNFSGKQVDICVTPNHRMLYRESKSNKWLVKHADKVKPGDRFLAHSEYVNTDTSCNHITIGDKKIDLKRFVEFAGYYVSEGSLSCKKTNYQVSISQDDIKNEEYYVNIKNCFNSLGYKYSEYRYEGRVPSFVICNKELSQYMKINFGDNAYFKYIPNWIKNLSKEYLEVLLDALVEGDGSIINHKNTINKVYTTVSKQLADDVQEIALKCGYNVRLCEHIDTSKNPHLTLYRIKFSKGKWSKGNEPRIKEEHISRKYYKGKVWCFTVPTGFFVTRRNGKIAIQGNSGKILQVTQEMEHIGKELLDGLMLNQALLNGEMCLPMDHKVVTRDGPKHYYSLSDKDEIKIWDDANRKTIFEKPIEKYKYDDVKYLYEFYAGDKLLFKCTPRHRILLAVNGVFITVAADEAHSLISDDNVKCDFFWEVKDTTKDLENEAKGVNPEDIIDEKARKEWKNIKQHNDIRCAEITNWNLVEHNASVFCFKTSTGFFFAEYDGREFITGNSGYQCHDVEQTEVLTNNGFKKYDDITQDDEIATFNKDTEELEYHPYLDRYDYDYDGEMYHFNGKKVDCFVTPNHKMMIRKDRRKDSLSKWETREAQDLPGHCRFRSVAKYKGRNAHPRKIKICDEHTVNLEDYIRLVCYFATEGSVRRETRRERRTFGEPSTTTIYQSEKGKAFTNIQTLAESITYRVRHYVKYDMFCIHNKKLSIHLIDACGNHSREKHIPAWIKELPVKYLQLALDCLIEGDGYFGHTVKDGYQYGFEVTSKQLANDLYEIAFKCGYAPLMTKRSTRDLYSVDFSDAPRGRFPCIDKRYVKKEHYKGRVFCFTVPNSFFVTRRNGKITIQGNSAQVGVETLIRRIESWRASLAEWAEENIFKPIAQMQGFVDKEETDEIGETIYMYPTIKWNDLNLKDKSQWHQMLMQLNDKGKISDQTMMEELDLDYDQEVERMRWESMQAGPAGGMMAPGGAPGGMVPGMEGGAAGAAAAPGGEMGGAPGGVPGMEGMGAPGGMGGDMGGGGGGGVPGAMASGGKIMKKGKEGKQEEMAPQQVGFIKLTQVEQKLAAILSHASGALKLTSPVHAQFPIKNPNGHKPYALDFALPGLKLGFEADGEIAHSSPEQVQHDKERDTYLGQQGWTVLRFDDQSIDDDTQAVTSTIVDFMHRAMQKGKGKKVSEIKEGVRLYKKAEGEFAYLGDNYDEYHKEYQ